MPPPSRFVWSLLDKKSVVVVVVSFLNYHNGFIYIFLPHLLYFDVYYNYV